MKGFNVRTRCTDFLAAKYLVVVRFSEVKGARVAIEKPEDLGKRAPGFFAGAGSGVAFVFALPDGSYLGAKQFSARSGETVHTTITAGETDFEQAMNVSAAANADLMRNIDQAIRTALATP